MVVVNSLHPHPDRAGFAALLDRLGLLHVHRQDGDLLGAVIVFGQVQHEIGDHLNFEGVGHTCGKAVFLLPVLVLEKQQISVHSIYRSQILYLDVRMISVILIDQPDEVGEFAFHSPLI